MWDALQQWLSSQLPGLVAGGGMVWLGNVLVSWLRDKNARIRGARHLAILLAVKYEGYALRCSDLIAGNDLYNQSGGHAGTRTLKLPDATAIPESDHWENVDHNLAERALTFPNVVRQADGKIEFYWEVDGDPDDMAKSFDEQAAITGLLAWRLACDLRSRYRLPSFRTSEIGWDFVALLQTQADRAEARREPE
jgi:hypothetical protein